jgi:hypothetical protein
MQFPPKKPTAQNRLATSVRPLALITLKNRILNPVAQLFADWMREAAKRLRKM